MLRSSAKRVSLSAELHLVMSALLVIRDLAALREPVFAPETARETARETDRAWTNVTAGISLVIERLRLLDRAARRQVDPALLHCAANEANEANESSSASSARGEAEGEGEGDVILTAWTEKESRSHARALLRRARRARKWRQSRRNRAENEASRSLR